MPRYHWSVEYFEDLRNVNHCEFIVMKQSETNKKFILQNELRTWSELKRRAAAANGGEPKSAAPSRTHSQSALTASPTIPIRRWGGCVNGCNHDKQPWPKRPMRKSTMEYLGAPSLPEPASATTTDHPPISEASAEAEDHPVAAQQDGTPPVIEEPTPSKLARKHTAKLPMTPASPNDASNDATSDDEPRAASRTNAVLRHLQRVTPGEGFSDDSDYFPGMQHLGMSMHGKSKLRASSRQRQASKERKLARKQTESWKEESGMGSGRRADALGDGDEETEGRKDVDKAEVEALKEEGDGEPILREALKGNMEVEKSTKEAATQGEEKIGEKEIEKLEEKESTAREQVY
jgi:hypothetical protein